MAEKRTEIAKADRRISILKAIVREVRKRIENHPLDARNIDLGFTPNLPRQDATKEIFDTFNELELLLDHLHIMHMAASFEMEALPRIGAAIGNARSLIRTSRKNNEDLWPVNLVRSVTDIQGLQAIHGLLATTTAVQEKFKAIREARNRFSHGIRLADIPKVSSAEAKQVLDEMLATLK